MWKVFTSKKLAKDFVGDYKLVRKMFGPSFCYCVKIGHFFFNFEKSFFAFLNDTEKAINVIDTEEQF